MPPEIDLEAEKRLHLFVREAIKKGWLSSVHDTSEGGLAVSLAESSFLSPQKFGFEVRLQDSLRPDALLFGEGQSRMVLSFKEENFKALEALAQEMAVPLRVLGRVKGDHLRIYHQGSLLVDIPLSEAYLAWKEALNKAMAIG